MAEYADEIGIAPATLYQWKRRLLVEDTGELETVVSENQAVRGKHMTYDRCAMGRRLR